MRRGLIVLLLTLAAAAGLPQGAAAVPTISFSCTPAPSNCEGWYRAPVTVHWDWGPSGAPHVGCDSNDPVTADTASDVRSCEVTDGVTIKVSVPLKVDMTPPLVTGATPSRPADANGWYRSPLQVAFTGTDATSGLFGCTSAGYGGPDGSATVAGTCTDNAGNVSAPSAFGLRYDTTAPSVKKVDAVAGDGVVRLRWAVTGATTVQVWRSPGRAGAARSLLDTRPSGTVNDRGVRNGRRYDYSVRATDDAGNATTRVDSVVPGRRLLGPAPGAQVDEPPLLRWTEVRHARYYNVQLFRNGRKVLSAWPAKPRLQLERSWRFGGDRFRLKPGLYRWLVWPGRGSRAKSDYGPLIGRRNFTIAP
jgi:hypothetical protein